LITDADLIKRLSEFIAPMCQRISIGFAGLDIVIDDKNISLLLEVNSRPGFEYFVRDNGRTPLIEMYKHILRSLVEDTKPR